MEDVSGRGGGEKDMEEMEACREVGGDGNVKAVW